MNPSDPISSIDGIAPALALDEGRPCAACSAEGRRVARAETRRFCEWWLSDSRREAWKVVPWVIPMKSD